MSYLPNQGSTARDFLAFERNFLTQCRFGLLLSLLSSSFLLLARIPTPDDDSVEYHPIRSARVPFGCLFFGSGFASIGLAVVYYMVCYRQMSHKFAFLRVSMFQHVTLAAMSLLTLTTCVLLLAKKL